MKYATLKIDDRAFRMAFKQWMWKSKRTTKQCLEYQAKLLVRDVVRITPPGHWRKIRDDDPKWRPDRTVRIVTQAEARRVGQNAVRGDIAKILASGRRRSIKDSARTIHENLRNKRGRVFKDLRSGRDRRYRVPAAELKAEIKRALDQIGLLASGWNAAAAQLGLVMPAWIARHGTKRGSIRVKISAKDSRITITNSVRFAGNVKDLRRRVNWGLNNRARQMDKQLVHLVLVETGAQSGFKASGK